MAVSPERTSRARARLGTELGAGLVLDTLLHVGGTFDVYRLRDDPSSVLKLVAPGIDVSAAELGRSLAIAEEVEHPRALGVLGEGDSSEGPYVLARFVEGESASKLVGRRPGRVPPAEAVRVVSDASEVILKAHQKNLVHGAITASHLLLSQSGGILVLGFGESRLRGGFSSAFRAPELDARDAIVTPASDQWALGAVLYALLTGESPYGGDIDSDKVGDPATRRVLDAYPHTPRPLARLLDRALASDPDQRFSDLGAFHAALFNAYETREIHYALPLRSPQATQGDGAPPLVPSREPLSPPRLLPLPTFDPGLPVILTPLPPSDTHAKVPDAAHLLHARATASTVPAPALFDPVRIAETEPPDGERNPVVPKITEPAGANHAPTPIPEVTEPPRQVRADTQPAILLADVSPPSVRRRREADLLLGITTSDDSETEALEKVMRGLDRAVQVSQDQGPDSAALNAELPALMELLDLELGRTPAGLACRVYADRIATDARTIWEPPGALSTALGRLHGAGVETLAFLPGLDPREVAQLVEVFATRDGFGTDIVTELYDSDFAHVLFHAPDPLLAFATDARRALEQRQRQLLALVDFDTSFALEDAWQDSAKQPAQSSDPLGASLEAMSLVLAEAQTDSLRGEELGREDEQNATRLSYLMQSALRSPELDLALAIAPRVRESMERATESDARTVLSRISQLVTAIGEPEATRDERRQLVFRAVTTERMLETLFRQLTTARAEDGDLNSLRLLVPLLDAKLAAALVSTLPSIVDHRLRAQVVHHLEFGISGHEDALAELAQESEPKLALEVIRLLGRIDSLAAKTALISAAESPFPVVRIEALGMSEGASGERLRRELKRLLEEAAPSDRIVTLRAICDAEIKFAAPFLALRVRAPKFDALEYEEKRLVFNALVLLTPGRAEALALDILDQSRLLSSAAHEDSRALAAEALGRTGASEDVLQALATHMRWRIGSSERVRSAAEAAHAIVKRRLTHSEPPPPPASTSVVPSRRPPAVKERPRDD
jgi:serine/threonine protein kinase